LFRIVVSARDDMGEAGAVQACRRAAAISDCASSAERGSPPERNPEPQEAVLELETGKLEQLGRLPEIDSLVEVVAEYPSFGKIGRAVGAEPQRLDCPDTALSGGRK
jgi:hypothetical protein